MIHGRRVLGLVVARSGSKGLPGKNLAVLGTKPLIAWSIEAALASRTVDDVVVSSDDEQILRVSRRYGAKTPFVRPPELAADDTPTMPVVFDALRRLPSSHFVVLLQPTSPLRAPDDIDACVRMSHAHGGVGVVSVMEAEQSPRHMFTPRRDGGLTPLLGKSPEGTRRQDLPEVLALNGAVYAAGTAWLDRSRSFFGPDTLAYRMPRERSVDIDDAFDLDVAQALIHRPLRAVA